jgi:hypothetical protein
MEWVPASMWVSYMTIDSPAAELDHDLAVSARPGVTPSLVDAGVPAPEVVPVVPEPGRALWPFAAGVGAALAVLTVGWRRWRDHLAAARPGDPRWA